MSKVLYISNYRDQTGYSQAARDYINSLKLAGVPVACRSIKLSPTSAELNEQVLEAERASTNDCNIVIQHTLPTFFEYHGGFRKNIGLFHLETDRIPQSWTRQCNLMDEIWVSCRHNAKACEDSGVTVPIKVVPIPCDTSKFERSYPKVDFRKKYESDYIFYTVGEFNKRKNLEAIIRAFHTAFKPNDPVQLLIKASIPGLPIDKTLQQVGDFCRTIKSHLGLYPFLETYKKELLVADTLKDSDVCSLHVSCDCFVSASYGEAWCLPAVDALGFDRDVIVPDNTAFQDYFNITNSHKVGCQLEPCFGYHQNSVAEVYTSRSNWYSPDITQIADKMKYCFENRDYNDPLRDLISGTPYRFNYEKIGKLMGELLFA